MQVHIEAAINTAFHCPHGNLTLVCHSPGCLHGFLPQFIGGDDFVYKADLLCLLGADHHACHAEFFGHGFSHQPGEPLRTPKAGYHTQIYFRLAEFCIFGGIYKIAGQGNLWSLLVEYGQHKNVFENDSSHAESQQLTDSPLEMIRRDNAWVVVCPGATALTGIGHRGIRRTTIW